LEDLGAGWAGTAKRGVAMKFAVLVAAAAAAGAVATVAVPSSVIDSSVSEMQALGDSIGGFKLADLNPLRAIFDWEAERIKKPLTPEEMGMRPSDVTATPYSFASPGYDPSQFGDQRPFGSSRYDPRPFNGQRPTGILPPDGPH
jgi:hypothetical protein